MNDQKDEESILKEVDVMTREDRRHIGNAKVALYVVCGILVLGAIIASFVRPADQVVSIWIEVVIVAGIFLVLSMLAEKWTFQSLLIGLIVFILYHALNAIIDPTTIFNGIIFKIAIIIYLSRGLMYAYDVREAKRKLNN
jgi:hypothetical protein